MDENRGGEFYCKGFSTAQTWTPPPTPGPGWERPGELVFLDEGLEQAYRRSRGAFVCRRENGFRLAYPLDCRSPFPLPELFCFARAECLGGRGWWVFSFGVDGLPCFESV